MALVAFASFSPPVCHLLDTSAVRAHGVDDFVHPRWRIFNRRCGATQGVVAHQLLFPCHVDFWQQACLGHPQVKWLLQSCTNLITCLKVRVVIVSFKTALLHMLISVKSVCELTGLLFATAGWPQLGCVLAGVTQDWWRWKWNVCLLVMLHLTFLFQSFKPGRVTVDQGFPCRQPLVSLVESAGLMLVLRAFTISTPCNFQWGCFGYLLSLIYLNKSNLRTENDHLF